MRRVILFTALTLLCTSACAADPAVAAPSADTAATLRDRALTDTTAWTVLEDLTSEVGPRLVGSPGMARAKEWAVKTFTDMGFTNVKVEEFAKPSWIRGPESAAIVGPYPFQLSIIGLGRTVPTPAGGIEAEVAVFPSYAALLAAPMGSLKGKIAVVTQPMTRTQTGEGYGAAGIVRRSGASEAAKRGAVAFLMRSVSTSDSRLPHTGVLGYSDDAPKIPAAALGVPDAELIERLAARGPVRIRMSLASTIDPDGVAWNISGEIRGSGKPEEVIVIGGHLDSWDPGTGAIDDAAGIAITAAAAKLIGDQPKHPRRTIRVVMWGSEESGGSSEAYLEAHRAELPNIVMASESDLGADRIYTLMLPKDALKAPALAGLSTVLAPLKIFVSRDPAPFGGSDVEGLQEAGVPVFTLRQDASRYFDLHHSADDTIDKVDPAQLNQNVAAWAALLWMLADTDTDFRAPTAAP
ncbi:MAG TPA: M20/M25/M40 family metallo-hydrolase [Caulobacter sp.]|nr:M20/M25/M40 family metallo-hydrolase [Caulobacter sp.]